MVWEKYSAYHRDGRLLNAVHLFVMFDKSLLYGEFKSVVLVSNDKFNDNKNFNSFNNPLFLQGALLSSDDVELTWNILPIDFFF